MSFQSNTARREASAIKVVGSLSRIRFHSEDKGNFFIGSFDADPPVEYAGSTLKVFDAKGSVVSPQVGLKYTLTGNWQNHPKYGLQLSFWDYTSEYPTDDDSLVRYLDESARWLGRKRAQAIVATFGAEHAIEVCKTNPALVAERIDGITIERARQIQEMLVENEQNEALQISIKELFKGIRIARKVINQITTKYKQYGGDRAIELIRENPYALIDEVDGLGFLTADELAKRLGFELNGLPRIQAGLVYVLSESTRGDGNCYLKANVLARMTAELLKVSVDDCLPAIGSLVASTKEDPFAGKLTVYPLRKPPGKSVYLSSTANSERTVAVQLSRLLEGARPASDLGAIPTFEGLNRGQKDGLRVALERGVVVLHGPPGVGKTHLVRFIIEAFGNASVKLCAPTGRAAKRLTELTSRPASTIHRLLEPVPDVSGGMIFRRSWSNPIDAHVIVIDEFSMCDIWLAAQLFNATSIGTRIVIVGDPNQLPSVGPGNVLRDIIQSGVIPTIELTEIMRQDPGLIVTNCHRIKRGEIPNVNHVREITQVAKGVDDRLRNAGSVDADDFYFFHKISEERIRETVFELVTKQLPALGYDPLHQVQVLAPLRHRTLISCDAFNSALQDLLNPVDEANGVVKHENVVFRKGDKVIQRRNQYQYDIINGDIGYVESIDRSKNRIVVEFTDPDRIVDLPLFDNELELAYACTVHSYQGSECPAIIIPIHKAMGNLIMQRPLLYTAISRAQRLCILVGQRSEIDRIIARNNPDRRNTRLAQLLRIGVELQTMDEYAKTSKFAILDHVDDGGDKENDEWLAEID